MSGLDAKEFSESKLEVMGFKFDEQNMDIDTCVAWKEDGEHIKFASLAKNGDLYLHRYNMNQKQVFQVKSIEGNPKAQNRRLKLYPPKKESSPLLFLIQQEEPSGGGMMYFYQMETLDRIGEYCICDRTSSICAAEPLSCHVKCFTSKLLAVAILLKEEDNARIQIIQGVLNDDNHVQSFNVVYTIQVPSPHHFEQYALASLPFHTGDCTTLFQFLYAVHDESCVAIFEFKSQHTDVIAQAKLAIAMGEFDHADELIRDCDTNELQTSFGSLHSSEVALHKFRTLIGCSSLLSGENKDMIKECLHRLTHGAVTGGSIGLYSLLDASKALREWSNGQNESGPILRDYRMALSAMAMSITGAKKGISSKYNSDVELEIELLQQKASALKSLENIIQVDKNKIAVGRDILGIRNSVDLFRVFLSVGAIKVAEVLRRSEPKLIYGDALFQSVLHIPNDVDPSTYCWWIESVVFRDHLIPSTILNDLIMWCCNHAESFDSASSYGLSASILILETFERGLNQMSRINYGSFASYTPFSISTISRNQVLNSDTNDVELSATHRTIYQENENFTSLVQKKLFAAKAIEASRHMGLDHSLLFLAEYDSVGGLPFLAKKLVSVRLGSSLKEDSLHLDESKSQLQGFCSLFEFPFDQAVEFYARDLCKNDITLCMSIATELVSICTDPDVKCRITLEFLRAALLSLKKPALLKDLAQNAISWTSNADLKSELEEATRLLGIDEIVRRYCGNKACDLFRVSDPLHVSRLAAFICRNIDTSSISQVLSDVLFLCEAFTHLSASEYMLLILKRMVDSGTTQAGECSTVFQEIIRVDSKIAEIVAARFCIYCLDIMNEASIASNALGLVDRRALFSSACSASIDTCLAMRSSLGFVPSTYKSLFSTPSWDDLRREIQRSLDLLQLFDVFVPLNELRSGSRNDDILQSLVGDVLQNKDMMSDEDLVTSMKRKLTLVKRCCVLLCGENSQLIASKWSKVIGTVACSLVTKYDDGSSLLLLKASGILDDIHNDVTYQTLASLVFTLCQKASHSSSTVDGSKEHATNSMKSVIAASSLLEEHGLIYCPTTLLPSMLFLNNLVDVSTQMILRCDCGIGEAMELYKQALTTRDQNVRVVTKSYRILHPNWHIGDGLLLPPTEALAECMMYCKILLQSQVSTRQWNVQELLSVHSFLADRGAHALSFRLLQYASMIICSKFEDKSQWEVIEKQGEVLQQILLRLAERSLGGSGNGNTNANIDSELAFSYLISLPLKSSFTIFKRCLPSAISRGDFNRLISLANVGIRAAGGVSSVFKSISPEVHHGWKSQETFLEQCHDLSSKGYWWKVLQSVGVPFDIMSFENNSVDKSHLVEGMIGKASTAIHDAEIVQVLAQEFSSTFNLDSKIPIQKHIEFLLSPRDQVVDKYPDIRDDLVACEKMITSLLKRLPSDLSKSSTLRKCLINMEKADKNGIDYERFEMLMVLYQRELKKMFASQTNHKSDQATCLQEIDRIDRRQDVLTILSSFFSGNQMVHRIPFPRFFLPLPDVLEPESEFNFTATYTGVLGSEYEQDKSLFDPIAALEPILDQYPCATTIAALSPMCISLGVPSGFIHARFLIKMFKNSKILGGSTPPFETDVIPVLKRLKNSKDAAELAEYCSDHYEAHSMERLKCLEYALNQAFLASNHAEEAVRRCKSSNCPYLIAEETKALDRVKRLTSLKQSLEDIIMVKSVINDELKSISCSHVRQLVHSVIKHAIEDPGSEMKLMPPEIFAERLLTEGSLVVSKSCLSHDRSIDIISMKKVAFAIHRACGFLEDQYSHVDIGRIVRKLVRKWLLHGDENGNSLHAVMNSNGHNSVPLKDIEENNALDESIGSNDDTAELVLDLKSLGTMSSVWAGSEHHTGINHNGMKVADEEQSCTIPNTDREKSEQLCAKVSIRVAFVMSFAYTFHSTSSIDENFEPDSGYDRPDPHEIVKNHAKYLMDIVFSKVTMDVFRHDQSFGCSSKYSLTNSFSKSNMAVRTHDNALTYAMRHRALRVASILCPESTLNEVVQECEYFGDNKCSLAKCCFGSFLAKEIESMGLPLPHSDLIQLSNMHHPSYARTLWRHHNFLENDRGRGRLLLLMIELALNEGRVVDAPLIKSILDHVVELDLPRSQFLICERISALVPISDFFDALDGALGHVALKLLKKIVMNVLQSVKNLQEESNIHEFNLTVIRLGRTICSFMKSQMDGGEVDILVSTICQSANNTKVESTRYHLFKVATMCANEINTPDRKECLLKKIDAMVEDLSLKRSLAQVTGIPLFEKKQSYVVDQAKDCLDKIKDIEYMKIKSIQDGFKIA